MVRAMQTGRADDIRWHLRQDGSRFFADGVLTKITGDDGAARGYVKILRDVTARTLVEENLRETEERSRFAAGAAQIGTWDYQPLTGSLIWDSRCKAFFGLDPEAEVTRDTALARLHPDDVALATEAIVAAFNPDSPDTFDLVFRTVSGLDNAKTRYIHAKGQAMRGSDGTAYRFLGIMQDVSEQKLLAAELLEAGRKNERIAETLQRSLLLAPPPDAFPGITLKTYYESAWDDALIGGDFFDVFAVAENVVGVVVGDVTGKGLEAATYTAEIKFILRGFLRETGDPADAMARLNRFVVDAERLDAADLGSTYIALSLACINTLTGQVECVTAGAEPPLLFRAGATGAEEVPPSGTMLGVAPDAKYVCYRYELAPGDLYIAYTDGVTEARRGKIFWGQEGLVNAVIETTFTRGDSLSTIADEIARRAKEWANGRQQDDVCLLLVRRL